MLRVRSIEISPALAIVATLSLAAGCAAEEDSAPTLDQREASGGFDEFSDPIIFVHGCPPPGATNQMAANLIFGPLMQRFRQAGYPESYINLFVYSGPTCDSMISEANELADFIDRVLEDTGAWQVDIVAHSMGALTTRLLLANDWHWVVNDFVSLAGANHGSLTGERGPELQQMFGAPAYEGMKELYFPYACVGEASDGAAADVQFEVNGCLTPFGRFVTADETPGGTQYLSIRNKLDEEIVPNESSCLNQKFQDDCRSRVNVAFSVPPAAGPCGPGGMCPAHVTITRDPDVIETVYDAVW